jgi:hypothetical protein
MMWCLELKKPAIMSLQAGYGSVLVFIDLFVDQ